MSNPNVTVVEEPAPRDLRALRECVHRRDRLDVVRIHHAVVGDYRSPDFDVGATVSGAAAGADQFLAVAADRGRSAELALTHSVFQIGCPAEAATHDPSACTGSPERATCRGVG